MFDPSRPQPWRAALVPLSLIYGGIVRTRRALYDHQLLSASTAPRFAISVGGLEVGGSGKTPVTGYILRQLLLAGRRPGLLTRGYGRDAKGLVLRHRGEPAYASRIGDEPAMLVADGLDIPVAAVARRALGAEALAEHCDTLVLDDAFSHRSFHRHLDIVVLRGEAPFGDGRLLPHGSLREPRSSLRRADVVWLHHRTGVPPAAPPSWVAVAAPHALCIMSHASRSPVRDAQGTYQPVDGASIVGAAGIARPREFEQALHAAGARVAAFHAFSDHHRFSAQDVARLRASMRAHAADALLVTPKDAVKLRPLWPGDDLWTMGSDVCMTFNEYALRQILENAANP